MKTERTWLDFRKEVSETEDLGRFINYDTTRRWLKVNWRRVGPAYKLQKSEYKQFCEKLRGYFVQTKGRLPFSILKLTIQQKEKEWKDRITNPKE